MKISKTQVFQPITVTFETEGELAFFVRALGSTNGTVANKFNVSANQQCKDYSTIYNKLGDEKMEKYPKLNSLTIQD
jgi:BioD-like phosphotransacetylase family protein